MCTNAYYFDPSRLRNALPPIFPLPSVYNCKVSLWQQRVRASTFNRQKSYFHSLYCYITIDERKKKNLPKTFFFCLLRMKQPKAKRSSRKCAQRATDRAAHFVGPHYQLIHSLLYFRGIHEELLLCRILCELFHFSFLFITTYASFSWPTRTLCERPPPPPM